MRSSWRWHQIGIRTFLILLTACCFWLGYKANRARQQKRAIDALRALGADITFHHQLDAKGNLLTTFTPPGPAWMRRMIGSEFFDSVQAVNLDSTEVRDADLEYLLALPRLENLDLGGTTIGDAGLAHVAEIRTLRSLDLMNTQISDAGVAKLRALQQLTELDLSDTRVSDASIACLLQMPSLKTLWFFRPMLTEKGLSRLAEQVPQVACAIDPHVAAIDEDGQETHILAVGRDISIRGSFGVPSGCIPFFVSVVEIVKGTSKADRVTMQAGLATCGPTVQGECKFGSVLQLPLWRPAVEQSVRGEIRVIIEGRNQHDVRWPVDSFQFPSDTAP